MSLLNILGVEVAILQEDGAYTTTQYLTYDDPIDFGSNGQNFSFCARVSASYLRGPFSYFVSLANEDDTNAFVASLYVDLKSDPVRKPRVHLDVCKHYSLTKECAVRHWMPEFTFQSWIHVCTIHRVIGAKIAIDLYLEGTLIDTGTVFSILPPFHK